jgi:general stress protein 26
LAWLADFAALPASNPEESLERSQTTMHEPQSQSEAIEKIWSLIKDIHVAMLTTTDPNGSLYSRPMATQQDHFTGELFYLTRAHSGKVDEIRDHANVNLTYVDTRHSTFVSLSGSASLSRDRTRINELWHPSLKAWFPNGEDDPEVTVLTVRVEEAEYWDAPSSAIVRNIRILERALRGGEGKMGDHARVPIVSKAS